MTVVGKMWEFSCRNLTTTLIKNKNFENLNNWLNALRKDEIYNIYIYYAGHGQTIFILDTVMSNRELIGCKTVDRY